MADHSGAPCPLAGVRPYRPVLYYAAYTMPRTRLSDRR